MVWENLMGWVGGVIARVCEVSYEFEYIAGTRCVVDDVIAVRRW